jgi:hypothetical protein
VALASGNGTVLKLTVYYKFVPGLQNFHADFTKEARISFIMTLPAHCYEEKEIPNLFCIKCSRKIKTLNDQILKLIISSLQAHQVSN